MNATRCFPSSAGRAGTWAGSVMVRLSAQEALIAAMASVSVRDKGRLSSRPGSSILPQFQNGHKRPPKRHLHLEYDANYGSHLPPRSRVLSQGDSHVARGESAPGVVRTGLLDERRGTRDLQRDVDPEALRGWLDLCRLARRI